MVHDRHAYGPLVRALREARRMNLVELGHAAGLSAGYLSRIEREQGRVASWKATIDLADALGVPYMELTGQRPAYRALREAIAPNETLEEFATAVGVSPGDLIEIETGFTDPDPEVLARIAGRLGVPTAVFTHATDRSHS